MKSIFDISKRMVDFFDEIKCINHAPKTTFKLFIKKIDFEFIVESSRLKSFAKGNSTIIKNNNTLNKKKVISFQ